MGPASREKPLSTVVVPVGEGGEEADEALELGALGHLAGAYAGGVRLEGCEHPLDESVLGHQGLDGVHLFLLAASLASDFAQ